jgi:hypothetical protein
MGAILSPAMRFRVESWGGQIGPIVWFNSWDPPWGGPRRWGWVAIYRESIRCQDQVLADLRRRITRL